MMGELGDAHPGVEERPDHEPLEVRRARVGEPVASSTESGSCLY